MDSKRSSLDDGSSTTSSLRRWARTPTAQKLGLKRSGASSPSSASIHSIDSEKTSQYGNGEVVKDECAWHKFFIWAAVTRNAQLGMTVSERTQCPWSACSKQCFNHEDMLRHLHACPFRSNGVYYCHGCGRSANFNGCRCECLPGNDGNPPSRRRRIMSMAKSVFSSLGRAKPVGVSTLAANTVCWSPSDDQLCELQSNPIHEIDSGGGLPMIPEYAAYAEFDTDSGFVSRSSSTASNPYACLADAQYPSRQGSVASNGFVQHWETPSAIATVAPEDLMRHQTVQLSELSLSQTTMGVECHQPYPNRRSKFLQPSSSVRSTTSTVSTVSTNSTNSSSTAYTTSTIASCDISPEVDFLSFCGQVPQCVSDFSCPVNDLSMSANLASPSSLLSQHQPLDCFGMELNGGFDPSVAAELPAELPLPFVDTIDSTVDDEHDALSLFPQPAPSLLGNNRNTSDSQNDNQKAHVRGKQNATAHSLLRSAHEMLEIHISQSASRLVPYNGNPVARQFCNMTTSAVTSAGLEVMDQVLQGQQPASPVKLLCFIHLVYSLSLLVHEDDSQKRLSDVFIEAISYSSWLPKRDGLDYIQVVDFLWKPCEMTDEEFLGLMKSNASPSVSTLVDAPLNSEREVRKDALVSLSQNFLDVLEYAALRETKRTNIQSSEVCNEHNRAVKLTANRNWSFPLASGCVIMSLRERYRSSIPLGYELEKICSRAKAGRIPTARRLELELLHSGKSHLSPEVYFDDFVNQVRDQVNGLQSQGGLMCDQRTRYHRLDIELMASEMLSCDGEFDGGTSKPANSHAGMAAFDSCQSSSSAIALWNLSSPTAQSNRNAMESTNSPSEDSAWLSSPASSTPTGQETSTASSSPSTGSMSKPEMEVSCEICGYRPKGDPKWFAGSVARHKRLQHTASPPKIFACPYPGCNSKYKNREDNLKQHQIEKGHFVEGEEGPPKGRKRKKIH